MRSPFWASHGSGMSEVGIGVPADAGLLRDLHIVARDGDDHRNHRQMAPPPASRFWGRAVARSEPFNGAPALAVASSATHGRARPHGDLRSPTHHAIATPTTYAIPSATSIIPIVEARKAGRGNTTSTNERAAKIKTATNAVHGARAA